jgi:hypothetical protein
VPDETDHLLGSPVNAARLRDAIASLERSGHNAWLRLLKWINGSLASITAAIAAAYAARPDAVKWLLNEVPVWAYFICAVPFFAIVNHALKRAKGK